MQEKINQERDPAFNEDDFPILDDCDPFFHEVMSLLTEACKEMMTHDTLEVYKKIFGRNLVMKM